MILKLPKKVYAPELSKCRTVLYWFTRPVDYGDLDQKSTHVHLPLWVADLIHAIEKESYWAGYTDHKKAVKKLLT